MRFCVQSRCDYFYKIEPRRMLKGVRLRGNEYAHIMVRNYTYGVH
jgi:hypothetical protein